MSRNKIIEDVTCYYNDKLRSFGATSKGVDWNSKASQEMRFEQLAKVIDATQSTVSTLDYGCGFGAMFPFLENNISQNLSFIGYDISQEMIEKARELYGNRQNTTWVTQIKPNTQVDYVVASGIFNVRLAHPDQDWQAYILDTLTHFDQIATQGFAFNMLTSYSDKEYMKDYLYYANPSFFFDFCKKNFSKYVAILHDYPLYEFTVLVKKQ